MTTRIRYRVMVAAIVTSTIVDREGWWPVAFYVAVGVGLVVLAAQRLHARRRS